MQVKFNDKKIEKTLKIEEKQRTRSLTPGSLPEPSNIQRGLFQQYISAIKFVTRKTRKLQSYEGHVFERMVQGILAYEDKNANIYNSFSINQSMTRDNYEEPTPRLNYMSGVNKKSILDFSQLENTTFDENILNHDKNPLTNSFIKEEVKKNEDKYFHSNHSPVHADYNDKYTRESTYGNDMFNKEMESNVNTNKGGSSDYSTRDYHHHRYTTSTPNMYEMKYVANKYEDNIKDQYRSRSKSFGNTHSQNVTDKYKQNHYSMPANKNPRFSVPANINANEKKENENMMSNRFSTIKSHSSSSGSGKSALNNEITTKNEVNDKEPEVNEEADTTITEVTVKKESKAKLNKKSSIKNDIKKNFSDMKNKLHKRRSTNNSPSSKPVSILKNKNSTSSKDGENITSINKDEDITKLQNIINQEDGSSNDDEEFIVISKKKMDTLIRTGKVHSIDDILKKNKHSSHSSVSSINSDLKKEDKTKDIVESPTDMKNDTKINENNNDNAQDESPDLANEETPVLGPPKSMENVPKPASKHTRSSSYGGISQSHIRGMSSNLATKHFPSVVPNGYATPMLGHQEPTVHNHVFNKAVPMDYATPMLPHFQNNNNNYSPMLKSDVPSVKDDITPPSRRGKSTYSIQNLLNNWPNIEELTQARENHPIFNRRKNSLPIYDRKTPLANTPITADSPIEKPTLKITDTSNPKKKGVNWDDNNKEYLIEKSNNEESYYDDIINNTYEESSMMKNEESSMMINDPTRLIFQKFNTSASNVSCMTEESTLQTPTIQTPTPMDSLTVPNKMDKRLNGLRNIITRDVLEDELPPTPITPTVADNTRLNGATAFEPDMPVRGESLNFLAKRFSDDKKVVEKNVEEVKKEVKHEDEDIENEEDLLTPIEKVEVSEIDENEIIDRNKDDNEDIGDDEMEEDFEDDSEDDSEDNIKLAEIPRFNKAILKLKVKRSANFDGDLASPCPTPTTYMINKIKEIEDKNKEKSDDELDYNSEEDLDILRFISYRRAPEVLEKHLKENEQEEENNGEYTSTSGNQNPEDPFNYSEETNQTTEDQTEEIELSDIENEIIEANLELELPKKMDRKDSVKSVISNISSKFSQKLNSMFSNSESSTAVNSSENESPSEKTAVENKPTAKEDNEVSVMTEDTIDEEALKENIEEQKEELIKSKDVLNFARKFSADFIKGGSELIRRSSKESLKSIGRKFSTQSDSQKPEEMESMMQKSNSFKSELQRRNSSASLTTRKENTSIISDDRSVKTTITSASLPRKDSLVRAASVKKNTSIRSVGTNGSNLTSTPIINPAMMDDEEDYEETPKIENFPERPERPIPQRPATPNAPNTPVFPNIKLCNILLNNEEPSSLNLNDQDGNNDIIVISNPLLEVTNNKTLANFKNEIPDERREFRISRNEAYMTLDVCPNAVDIESAMGSIIDPDDDSRMEMLGESSLSFRSINPNSVVYEEKDSVILSAPKLNKGKKPELEIDTKLGNTSKVVAIIPSPVPQKDNFAQRFNNLNAASLIQETREQQQKSENKSTVAMKKYVALYPYNARDGRELSFQRADIINVRREQGEWVYGFKENLIEDEEIKYGWVPKSYLKIISIF